MEANYINFIQENIAVIWLVSGVLFLFLEAMAAPGLGFLFAGLAAISVGGLISFETIHYENYRSQFLVLLISILVWTALLWYPLRKFRMNKDDSKYQNIRGDDAIIISDSMINNQIGKVKWSGTGMKARASIKESGRVLQKGDNVTIESIKGNVLTIVPTNEYSE